MLDKQRKWRRNRVGIFKKTKKDLSEEVKANLSDVQKFEIGRYKYDLLAQMRKGTSACQIVDFDGVEIPLRLLSQKEIHGINLEVMREKNAILKDEHYYRMEDAIYMRKVLSKATTKSPIPGNDNIPVFNEETVANMTPHQIEALYQIWVDFNSECSPCIDNMTDDSLFALYEDLKKNPNLVNSLTPFQLRKVILLQRAVIISATDN
jgi:hypothetical protein